MGGLVDYHLAGWFVPYPDLHELETDNDGATNNSSYSQAGPRPGIPVPGEALSTLLPVISGGQDGDLVLAVLQSGAPGRSLSALQMGYRYASDASTLIRGWTAPNGLTDWDSVHWVNIATSEYYDAVTHPDDQRVLVAFGDAALSGGTKFARWDPATHTWESLPNLANGAGDTASAMLVYPSGRVLLCGYASGLWRSDDFGDSWTRHAEGSVGSLHGMRMCQVDSELLLVGHSVGGNALSQFASNNGGARFTQVGTITSFGTRYSLCPLPDGRIAFVYRRAADGYPCCRVIASPWDPLSGATEVVIESTSVDYLVAAVDPDGCIWVYGNDTAAPNLVYAWGSLDGGTSFTKFSSGPVWPSNSSSDQVRPGAATATNGAVMLIHKSTANTATHNQSYSGLLLGGWESRAYAPPAGFTSLFERAGFGFNLSTSTLSWLPIELPNDAGWTATGAGTGALNAGRLELSTSGNVKHYSRSPGTNLSILVRAGLRVVSGGALASRQIGLTVAVGNASNEYRVDLRFTTTGIRVHDPHASGGAGTNLATVSDYDTTAEFDILVEIDTGTAAVYYKRPYESAWSTAWSGTLTNLGSGSTNFVNFGHLATGTAQSAWRYCAYATQARTLGGTEAPGRPIGTEPVPLHAETSDGTRVARLSALGGIGALSETYDVPARYDYPATAIYPQLSPSPAERWRTTSKAEQRRAWLLGSMSTLLGDVHVGILALNCNFRTAYLQSEQAGWNTICTLDLAQGFTGLDYTRTGDVIMGRAGGVGSAPGRYLQEGELAGGYAVITTGGGTPVARRIRWNTAGYWTGSTSTRRALIFLDGVSSADDTSSTCDLVWSSGVAVNYTNVIDVRTRYRLLIPANQVTPDDYYQAGILVPGAIRAPGAPPDWGYSHESEPNVSERRTPYGTTHRREIGPPIRSITFGWAQSGVDLSRIRGSATDGNYVGISGQIPFAVAEDVPWMMAGLQSYLRSGEIPAAALMALPSADGTLTDMSLIYYGRLSSSVAWDHELGDEGEREVLRTASVTVTGLPWRPE